MYSWSPFEAVEGDFIGLTSEWKYKKVDECKLVMDAPLPYRFIQSDNPEVAPHLVNYNPLVHFVDPFIRQCFLEDYPETELKESKETKRSRSPRWAAEVEEWMRTWRRSVPVTHDSLFHFVLKGYCHRDYACIWEFFQRFGKEWPTKAEAKKNSWYENANKLVELFARCPPLPPRTRLFEGRGRYEGIEGLPELKVGQEFCTTRPHSTSWHPDVALRFVPASSNKVITSCLVVYEVASDSKIPAICVEAVSPLLNGKRSAQECEIILPPFVRCRVTKKEYFAALPQQLDDFVNEDFPPKGKEWKPCREVKRCFVIYVALLGV